MILGSGDAGATRNDWISFARLVSPLHKTLDRFDRDSGQFEGLLRTRAGADGSLFGNLKINGSLSGNAIRYRYVEGTGGSASVRIADISTQELVPGVHLILRQLMQILLFRQRQKFLTVLELVLQQVVNLNLEHKQQVCLVQDFKQLSYHK